MYGELVPLEDGDPIPLSKPFLRIGRRRSSDIVLRDPEVSSCHAELRIIDGYWWVFDKRSKNGVWVNGVSVPKKRLDPGDIVAFGKPEYVVEYPEQEQAEDGEISSKLAGFLEIVEAGQLTAGKQKHAGRYTVGANGREISAQLHAAHERRERMLIIGATICVGALVLLAIGVWAFRSSGKPGDHAAPVAELPEVGQPKKPADIPRTPSPAGKRSQDAKADPGLRKPRDTDGPAGGQNAQATEREAPGEQAVTAAKQEPLSEPKINGATDVAAKAAPPVEPPIPGTKRLPLPALEAQEKMARQFDEVYKFSQQISAAQKAELSKRLFELGKRSQGGPVEKFVFFRKAMELAGDYGDADLMLQVVDSIGEEFDVDALNVKQKVLVGFVAGTPGEERVKSFFDHADAVIDEALAAGRCDVAVNLAEAAYGLSQKSAGKNFRKHAYDRRNQVQKLAATWAKIQEARTALKADPDDPQANLALGRWLCLTQGQWEQGLPHLAKCSDPALQSLAVRELISPPAEPGGQVKLADDWWALAAQNEGQQKVAMMLHAGNWYENAAPKLPEGFARDKVANRLAEIEKIGHPAESGTAVASGEKKPAVGSPRTSRLRNEMTLDLGGGVKMEFVLIPAGSFVMGDAAGKNHEKPAHKVTISQPFYLGKYEVTQEQWQALMGNNPSKLEGSKNPVESVSWEDCQSFLKKLNEEFGKSGATFSLPTEAQWEYACRAGSTTKWSFGDDEAPVGDFGWFSDNSSGKTHPVGQKKPNAWGLYDMHGNVMEWCADPYGKAYYESSPSVDPPGPASSDWRVVRGGSFNFGAEGQRSACRVTGWPAESFNDYGFRVAGTAAKAGGSR